MREFRLVKRLIDVTALTIFGYFLFASLFVLYLNGYTSRISLMGFLIPHASKLALWSAVAILWLRPKFGWKFPFAVLFLYCLAELTTNWIYVTVHLVSDPTYIAAWTIVWNNQNYYFVLSNAFFILGIILANVFVKGTFSFKKDWSMLPFGVFVGFWVATGYITDATAFWTTPFLEFEEFMWSVLYLLMMWGGVLRPKVELWKDSRS